MRRALPATLLALALLPAAARADTLESNGLRLVPIVGSNFDTPVYAASPPGDPSRVFVVEQGSGTAATIRVVHDGVKLADPFLTFTTEVAHHDGEQGLLSMAFAPDYATSGLFYVYYNDAQACSGNACDVRVDEFKRLDDDHADFSTRRRAFFVTHRQMNAGNHNGATLQFGRDGLLYAGPGDGGTQDDPECDAQSPSSNLGKILRIDPRVPGATPQIYALGLRNPFRFSFDHLTGDLLIGDVGGGVQEEIDFLAAGTPAGEANFGWNRFEGVADHQHDCIDAVPPGYVAPAIHYDHGSGQTAVTGGYVVRDTSVPPLRGRYLYADYFAGDIHSAVVGPSTSSGDGLTGLQVGQLASFGEDSLCRIYVVSQAGPVYRLEATQPAGAPACEAHPSPPAPELPPPPPDTVAPRVSGLTVSRHRFRVSSAATPGVARTRTPTGTVFRYTVSETADVTLRFYRATTGRRSGRRCVATTRRLRRAPRCTRYPLRGTLVRRRVAPGRRMIRFTGRVGVKALPLGRYRAILRARDAAGNLSAGRVVVLQIVAR